MEPLLSYIEAWKKLLSPAFPELPEQLLDAMPSLSWVEDFLMIECFRGELSFHLFNEEMVWSQWRKIFGVSTDKVIGQEFTKRSAA